MNKTFGVICANYDLQNFGSLLDHRTIASLPFAGRYRMIDFPLTAMVEAGINTVGLIMPYYYRSLIDHVGTGKAWGLDRKTDGLFLLPGSSYSSFDSIKKIHIGDLLTNHRYIERRSDDTNALFMGASYVYNIDLKPIITSHEESKKKVTVVYTKTSDHKKKFIDIIMISKTELLLVIERYKTMPFMSLLEAVEDMFPKKDFNEYIYDGYAKEILSVNDYMSISMDMLKPTARKNVFKRERQIITKTQDEAPALYKESSSIRNSYVSAGCVIEGKVENCILFRNVVVEKGASLKNCIIMQHTTIKTGSVLNNVIADKYVTIGEGIKISGKPDHPIIIPKNEDI